ncbi:MAG: terpene cyclase/mutase family protein [Planctomycetota bacterium]|nr:terpene cyclase/mutase family protein [Planctomycetota bacterium]
MEREEPAVEVPEEPLARPRWLEETRFWALSAVLHLLFIGLFLALSSVSGGEPRQETFPLAIKRARTPPPYDPLKRRAIEEQVRRLLPRKTPKVVLPRIDPFEPDIPRGDNLKNRSSIRLDDRWTNPAIGVGSAQAGDFGARRERGSGQSEGATPDSEAAVRAALGWLRRHQSPDGSWRCRDFTRQCKRTCRNVDPQRYGDGRGFAEHDVGVTALAMLAFTGYGQTHRDGDHPEYVECLRKAVRYMKRIQVRADDPMTDGRYGPGDHEQWIYDHSIATMAMAELLVMSVDVLGLKRSVNAAVRLCLRAQNDGFGWRYGVKSADNDTSVTGWMVLALKTAKNARLGIPQAEFDRAFEGAIHWFDRATAANGKCGYMVPGDEGSRLARGHPDPYPYSKELSCMTAVSVLCRLFGGAKRREQFIRDGVKVLMQEPPTWQEQKGRSLSRINLYYWYYGTFALFQFGGREWSSWNRKMQESLIRTQRQGNIDEDGSWDPIGEWGIAGGRVYATALGALTLEVYYRYVRQRP